MFFHTFYNDTYSWFRHKHYVYKDIDSNFVHKLYRIFTKVFALFKILS